MTFRSTFDRMIAARERQAQRYVNGALLAMDDETLRRAGYDRKTLQLKGNSYLPL